MNNEDKQKAIAAIIDCFVTVRERWDGLNVLVGVDKAADEIIAALQSVDLPFVCPRCGMRGTTDGICSSYRGAGK